MNELTELKNEVASPEDFKKIATEWLTSTGNLQKFNENEKAQFLDICCAFKLNPIKREVYGVKYKSKDGKENFNLILSYEVYLKRAQKTGLLDGFKTETVKEGNETKAICTIYRKDWKYPFVHEVLLSEYHQHNSMWNSKPITMIKKVAEAQAFRKCFTDDLGGLPYTADELPEEMTKENFIQAEVKTVTAETKKETKKVIAKYTPEEASKIGDLLKTEYEGKILFEKSDCDNFRVMLINEGGQKTLEAVKKELSERIKKVEEEIETTLNAEYMESEGE